MNYFGRLHGLMGTFSKKRELELLRKIANMELNVEVGKRAQYAKGLVYDKFDGGNADSRAKIDLTKTTVVGALTSSAKTATVVSSVGFKVGQEVTIYDDVLVRRVVISAVRVVSTTHYLDFVTTVGATFKSNAGIARTNAVVVGGELTFGTWNAIKLLECDVRYNFENTDGELSEVVTWIEHDATCTPDDFEVTVTAI